MMTAFEKVSEVLEVFPLKQERGFRLIFAQMVVLPAIGDEDFDIKERFI